MAFTAVVRILSLPVRIGGLLALCRRQRTHGAKPLQLGSGLEFNDPGCRSRPPSGCCGWISERRYSSGLG